MDEKKYAFGDLVFLCVDDIKNYNSKENNFVCGVLNNSKTQLLDVLTGEVYDCKSEKIIIKRLKRFCLDFNKKDGGDYYDEEVSYKYSIEKDHKQYESFNVGLTQENNGNYRCKFTEGIFSDDKLKTNLLCMSSAFDFKKELSTEQIKFLLGRMNLITTKKYNEVMGIKVPTGNSKKVQR